MIAMDQLFHIVYVSRRIDGLSRHEIVDGIVLPAMLKNRRLNISGCIWFDEHFFFQIIEGVKSEVLNLYKTIEDDHRHQLPQVLAADPIERRSFERFSMRLISDGTPVGVRQMIEQYDAVHPSPDPGSAERGVQVRRLITEISSQFV